MSEHVTLSGWGRTAPTAAELGRVRALPDAVAAAVLGAGSRGIVARGLGRSYGDAAQNAGGQVLLLEGGPGTVLDRQTQVVHVTAGVSLDTLIRELLPQGFFVPVTPGTRFVTVGGAIAADIHGKNHHVEGTFGQQVQSLVLVTADGQVRQVSRELDPQLFWATVGGMGLTGIVVSAVVKVKPVESAYISVDTDRTGNLDELLTLMRETDADYTYSVAWIDLVAKGASLGRGVLTRGEHASRDQLPAKHRRAPLHLGAGQLLTAPRWLPDGLVNHASVRAFNELWFRKAPRHRADQITSLAGFFHPLDGVGQWNRLYGRRGLVQYQFVVPDGAEAALSEAVRLIADAGQASFLAVLKRFGAANDGLLSFPMAGWTLALDLPADPDLSGLLDRLDEVVIAAGGRIYLAKDSRARAETIEKMYPRLPEFRALRQQWDPEGVFTSDLARRLAL